MFQYTLIFGIVRRARRLPAMAPMLIATALLASGCGRDESASANPVQVKSPSDAAVELSENQQNAIKIEPAATYAFSVEKEGVGTIDFDNNVYFDSKLSVQVFPPYEGTILKMLVELDDEVKKGQPLYVMEGPDHKQIDVPSPISGRVAAVNAPPGLYVRPGVAPAPVAVANVSVKWMLANVIESDSPFYRMGEPVRVKVLAYPDRVFHGKVSRIYPSVDPNSHRITIRFVIADPRNELRSGMLTEFTTQVQKPVESVAIPANGIVREGDGTMTAWVTTDRHRFVQRTVKAGLRQDDRVQILDGVKRGELVVTDGAVFLSNMLQTPPGD